jgi:uncharacterized membrane protein
VDKEAKMEIMAKHISHKLIDSLSDGVFAVALTLLGFDVVSLVPGLTKSEDLNAEIGREWPTFLAYILGFVVLISMWYFYHMGSQYVEGTNAWVVWNHAITMLWVSMMPFGVSLLASTLDSPNRKWGVFYFGICLFGTYWFTFLQMATRKFKIPVNFTNDLPLRPETMRKIMVLTISGSAALGLVLVLISLINPWLALAGYSLFIVTNMNPVRTFNKGLPKLIARLERK